ncbi:LamG domain-containing protein [Chitinophaga nivalis]|uniref:LamG domain-containing protein n=1 Tax=Chitinophaga nivalis TaxID=2991709 RepID=A0ABT3ITK1_9BACT|nr:LamG domain-containing protein [Chitinophaga nivalis]MCW3462986.1 LamG domain-containing protein [Chitinophaga nivalis]MCW3487324.1 LamG domain-containing protein [Chitinophaga nivalis]
MNLGLTMRWGYSALQFNGNAYAYFPSDHLNNMQSFTLAATFFPTTSTGTLIWNSSMAIGCLFGLHYKDGFLHFTGLLHNKEGIGVTSSTPLSLNEWHQVAVTFDGPQRLIKLYQDGKEVASKVVAGAPYPDVKLATLIGVGKQITTSGYENYLNGQIARVVIWKSVRNAFEILEDALAITPPMEKLPDLVFWTDFTEMPTDDRSGYATPITYSTPPPNYLYSIPSVKVTENGAIDCGVYADYDFGGHQPYTVEGWFNPAASTDMAVILSFAKDWQWQYYIQYDKTNSRIIAKRNTDSQEIYSKEQITEGRFYHFAISYNGDSKMMRLYVNGNLQTAEYFPAPVASIDQGKLLIGGNGFTGYFQNVRLWKACLEQSELRQWMLNDVITDPRLVANFDFTVTPPIDSMGHAIQLLEGTANTLADTVINLEERKAQLGIAMPINSSYFNNVEEAPLPPPTGIKFAPQSELFSPVHKEQTFTDLVNLFNLDTAKQSHFREVFEKAYTQAETMFTTDPRLGKVVTRTDENGRTKIVYHSLRGDVLMYDRPIGEISDCTIWWISFTFTMSVSFFGIFLPLPIFSPFNQIPTKVFNLIVKNAKLVTAITALVGTEIGVASGLNIITEMHREKVLWPVLKFSFIAAGWFALGAVLARIITLLTGTVAAEILAKFIVWTAQLTKLSLEYQGNCGKLAENKPVPAV